MYMKECPNCKELIGDNARSCFNCGYDFIYKRVRTQQEKRELEQIEKQKRAEKQAEKEKHQIQIQKTQIMNMMLIVLEMKIMAL